MLNVGDKIIFNRVGAYTMTLSPLFIHYFPIIYRKLPNDKFEVIRNEWNVNNFISDKKF